MLLAFDIGNTNIVIGIFKQRQLMYNWRLKTDSGRSADEYILIIEQLFRRENIDPGDIKDVIVSTVVSSMLYSIQHLVSKYFGLQAIIVDSTLNTGLTIEYAVPKQLGADRIVNASAALAKYGGPLIVVDFGTATTFCAVTEDGRYLGGAIAPGIKISSDALFEKTANLPKTELEYNNHVIGRSTIQCIQSGLVYGHMGTTEYICRKMKEELSEYTGSEKKIKVIATGGMSEMMASGIECIDYIDRSLTLDGLALIYEMND